MTAPAAPRVASSRRTDAWRFVDPTVLARIGNLELVARAVVEGFINGLHRSPHLGASMDFAEHRAYMPGDDIRRIDWRLYARTDRYYVKEFEADTNTNFVVLLDTSKSMHYAGPTAGERVSKIEYASFLAACLAHFAGMQRDRVGLVTFDREVIDYVPPSARHLQQILHVLDRVNTSAREQATNPPAAEVPLATITKRLSESFRRRSMIVLISDLYEEPDSVFDALVHLRGKGNDIIVFHVLDHAEIEFPFTDAASFRDLESGTRMPIVPEYLRKQYKELVAAHSAALERKLGEGRVDYALFDTSKPLDYALFSYLSSRERLSRVR